MSEKKAYITFIESQQEELTFIHSNAIRKFDKTSTIIYISNEQMNQIPNGALNFYGIDIRQNGLAGLSTFLSSLKVMNEQTDIKRFILSNVTCILRQDFTESNNASLIAFIENRTTQFCKSVISFNEEVLMNVIEYTKHSFNYDLFGRNPFETFLFIANSITSPNQKIILQLVNKDGKTANGAFFNSSFYSNIQQLLTVFLFVECADSYFLSKYAQARLNLNEAIKRAMQHVLKAWKGSHQKRIEKRI